MLALLLVFFPFQWAMAKEAAPAAEAPAIERRMSEIAAELRCLVCQNQSIVDSNAPLAIDLRNQIRDQLEQGRSAREIMDYMVARYGDFVLYRPPFKATTVLLWVGPLLLMLAGLIVMVRRIARRKVAAAPLSKEEHEAAERLLSGGGAER
ncbi:MAG: cytochrome c-type biogenesis protein [Betaproteobacteria bacterium]